MNDPLLWERFSSTGKIGISIELKANQSTTELAIFKCRNINTSSLVVFDFNLYEQEKIEL